MLQYIEIHIAIIYYCTFFIIAIYYYCSKKVAILLQYIVDKPAIFHTISLFNEKQSIHEANAPMEPAQNAVICRSRDFISFQYILGEDSQSELIVSDDVPITTKPDAR